MNSLIEDKLAILAEDEIALRSIQSVFTEEIEKEKPIIKEESNELLGQKYRAYEIAKTILNGALKNIKNYKKEPKGTKDFDKSK